MKTQRFGVPQAAVQEQDHMVIDVVDKSERTDTARFQAKVLHHSFGRRKREFTGGLETLRDKNILEPMLDIVNRQIVVTRKADQVMLVTLVIAHEDVLAMHTPVIVPPPLRLLDGLALRVIVGRKRNAVFVQIAQDALLSIGYYLVVFHISHFVDCQTIRGRVSAIRVRYE